MVLLPLVPRNSGQEKDTENENATGTAEALLYVLNFEVTNTKHTPGTRGNTRAWFRRVQPDARFPLPPGTFRPGFIHSNTILSDVPAWHKCRIYGLDLPPTVVYILGQYGHVYPETRQASARRGEAPRCT